MNPVACCDSEHTGKAGGFANKLLVESNEERMQ